MTTPEQRLTRIVLERLGAKDNVLIWRSSTGVGMVSVRGGDWERRSFGVRGQPDLTAIWQGKYLGIEVKATGRLSKDQVAFHRRATELGAIMVIIRTEADIDALEARLSSA